MWGAAWVWVIQCYTQGANYLVRWKYSRFFQTALALWITLQEGVIWTGQLMISFWNNHMLGAGVVYSQLKISGRSSRSLFTLFLPSHKSLSQNTGQSWRVWVTGAIMQLYFGATPGYFIFHCAPWENMLKKPNCVQAQNKPVHLVGS